MSEMKMLRFLKRPVRMAAVFSVLVLVNTNAVAQQDDLEARMAALEKELSELRAQLEQRREEAASKQDVQELKQDLQATRADLGGWKTYDSKVHLAGYAAAGYASENEEGGDGFHEVNFNPIFHFGYKDLILLESELEIELEDGTTETALEYLTVDWFINDYATLVAGKFLSPLGQFQQNLHPSWINKLPSFPAGFGHGGANPLAEVGAQVRGGFQLPTLDGRSLVNYALFVGNGPRLELAGHHDEEEGHEEGEEEEEETPEIEAIEAEGFTNNLDDNKVFGGRFGFLPVPNLEVGFSGAFGDVALEDDVDRDYTVLGVDFTWRWKNLDLRGEWIGQDVDGAAASIAPEGQEWKAWYGQASYKLLPTNFEIVARYSELNSTHADQERDQRALGLNYLFSNHAMAKVAYEINDGPANTFNDEDRFLFQFAYGF